MKKVLLSAVAVAAAVSVTQTASAREFADIYVDCGLGAIIAPNTPVVAAVTNVTWDLGTTAVISNASSPDTCKGGKAKTAAFIHDSYEPIEKDLARGHGEYLNTMMEIAGIDVMDRETVAAAVREKFASRIAEVDYASESRFEKAEALFNIVQEHTKAS